MKQVFIFIFSLLFTASTYAEDSRPWWRSSTATDVATVAADSATDYFFSDSEKNVLDQYLKNYRHQMDDGRDEHHDEDDDHDKKHSKYKKENHKHKGKDNGKKKHKDKKKKKLPPGLRKKVERGGELPPGWQKKVARGEVLDGEMYEVSSDLPKGILKQLPNAPDGTSVRQIEDTVVRVMDATGEILDVLTGSGN